MFPGAVNSARRHVLSALALRSDTFSVPSCDGGCDDLAWPRDMSACDQYERTRGHVPVISRRRSVSPRYVAISWSNECSAMPTNRLFEIRKEAHVNSNPTAFVKPSFFAKVWLRSMMWSFFMTMSVALPMTLRAQDVGVNVYDSGWVNQGNGNGVYYSKAHWTQTTNGVWGAWSYGGWAAPEWRLSVSDTKIVGDALRRVPFWSEEGWGGELSTFPNGFHVYRTFDYSTYKHYKFGWTRGPETNQPTIHRGCVAVGTYNGSVRAWAVLNSSAGTALYEYTLYQYPSPSGDAVLAGERKLRSLSGIHRGLAYSQGSLWLYQMGSGAVQYVQQINPENGSVIKTLPLAGYSSPTTPQLVGLSFCAGKWYMAENTSGSSGRLLQFTQNGNSLDLTMNQSITIKVVTPPAPFFVAGVGAGIKDRQTVAFSLAGADLIATESPATGGDPAGFKLVRNLTAGSLTVNMEYSGTATEGLDYPAMPRSYTFAPGQSEILVPVLANQDSLHEGNETFTAKILPGEYTREILDQNTTVTVTLIDATKHVVTIAATDASATEGGDSATFTISRGSATSTPLTIKLAAPTGTAASTIDYTALPTSVVIPANAASATVTLGMINDTTAELPETVILALASDAAYVIGSPSSATATIQDNEAPVITIVASDANAKEGGVDNGRFTLTRLGSRTSALSVNVSPGGSAAPGIDYTALNGTVTIAANVSTLDYGVTVLEDTVPETDETVIATVQSGTGYTVGSPASATVTIADNETPTLSIVETDATAAEEGLSTGTFTITRLGTKSTALTVNLSLAGSSASNGTDFDTIPGTLALGANVTTATITVKPKDDTAMEPAEIVLCTISSGTGYVVGSPSSGTVTITDNDTQTVTIHATSTNAAEPATNGAFVVRRVGPTTGALTVTYAIATGTGRATNGSDFNTIPLTATIAAGNTESPSIPITVINDANYEGPETVQLTISSSSLYVIGSPSVATVTIADNDKPTVTASLVDGTANEPSDTGKYRVTRDGILSLGTLVVKYAMTGRAINGTDYSTLSGIATIAQGSAAVDITLTPLPDAVIEGAETATFTIVPDAAYNIGPAPSASVVIGPSVITSIAGTPPVYGDPVEGGTAASTPLDSPTGIAIDATGNKFIADVYTHSVWRITPAGVINRYAGQAYVPGYLGFGGAATSAGLTSPEGVAVDAAGNLYIADTGNNRICKVAASTKVLTVVVNATTGTTRPRANYSGDGGAATAATLRAPSAIAVDAAGNLYIADTGNNRIRKVTVSTGIITTIAGNGTAASTGDGAAATAASVNGPKGVDLDAAGNVYIADTGGSRIRKVTVSTGVITTIAGSSTAGYAGDGGSPTAAQLNAPHGVAISDSGEVFIADTMNHRVRKIDTGLIITVAGNGTADFGGDNGAATLAKLSRPVGLAFDVSGNLYLADSDNAAIRRLAAGISAIARRAVEGTQQVILAMLHPGHIRGWGRRNDLPIAEVR
jgi:sugar lactone lactonase YvrE